MKIQICFILILLATILFADIPQAMNYQGKLTDPAGVAVEGETEIIFRIYDVATGGTALWTETHPVVEVDKGLFDVRLGSITPLNLPFDEGYYVELEVEGEVLAPRQALNSVGYAFRAGIADSVVGGGGASAYWTLSGSDLYANSTGYNIGIGTTSPAYDLDVRSKIGIATADETGFINIEAFSDEHRIRFNNSSHLEIGAGAGYSGIGSYSEIMRLDGGTRNVGIGTTNPLARLALDGDGAAHYGMFIEGPSTNVDGQAALYIHSNPFSSDPPDIYNKYYGIYVNQEPATSAVYHPTAIYGNMSNVASAYSTGVLGRSIGTGTGGGRTYGVKGYAGGGSDHYNYAVYGELQDVGDRQGTAILGYDAIDHSGFDGTLIDGNWAGYFHGNLIATDRTYFGDLDAYIRQDGSNNMVFRDPNTNSGAEVSLSDLYMTGNFIQNQKDSLQTAYYRIRRTFTSNDTLAYIQFSPTTTSDPSYSTYGLVIDGTEFTGKGAVRGIAASCSLGTNHAADGRTTFYGAYGTQYTGHGSMWGGYGRVNCSQLDGWDSPTEPYKSRAIGLWGVAEATAPLSFDDAQPEFCFAGVRGEIIGSVNNSFSGPDTSIVAAVLGIDKTTGAGKHYAGLFLGDVMATGKIESGNIVIRGESETNDASIQYRNTNGGSWDYQEERLINYGRAGNLSAGYWDYAAYRRARILIKFDVSEIPADANIISANIRLYCYQADGSGTYYVYRLRRHWDEGDNYCGKGAPSTYGHCDSTEITGGCSWEYYSRTNAWGTSGADNTTTDRYSTSESSLSISTTGWKTWNVTSAIQSIVDGTDENYGFIIIGPTSGNNRAYFKSSECAEFELKPRLEIEWTY